MIEGNGSGAAELPPLDRAEGLLWRQVHPKLFKNGQPTSVNFRPGTIDAGKLSVDRSSVWTAEQAYGHRVEHLGKKSAGAWAFTVDEVLSSGTTAHPDPQTAEPKRNVPENPAHAFVDFRGKTQIDAIALILKDAAIKRGPQYTPPGS